MQKGDLKSLAILNVSRGKSAKKTAISLAVSLVMINLFLFLIFNFNGYIFYNIAKEKTNYIISVEEVDPVYNEVLKSEIEKLDYADSITGFAIIFEAQTHVGNHERCNEAVYLDSEKLQGNKTFEYSNVNGQNEYGSEIYYRSGNINEDDYIVEGYETEYALLNYATTMQVIDTKASGNRFAVSSLFDKFGLKRGGGFSGEACRQIMVSERFLHFFNVSEENLIGKKLSYDIEYLIYDDVDVTPAILDDDNVAGNEVILNYEEIMPMNIHIFKDFEIVGVFSDEYLEYNCDSDFIVSANSFDITDFPQVNKTENKIIVTYKSIDYETYSEQVVNSGKIFPFLLYNKYASEYFMKSDYLLQVKNPIILTQYQGKNFHAVKSFYNDINNSVGDTYKVGNNYLIKMLFNPNISAVLSTNREVSILMLFLIVYGGTIFIATIFSFYNMIAYHTKARKGSLKMFKIMGFTAEETKSLFSMEIGIIFKKSIISSSIASFILSAVLLIAVLNLKFLDKGIMYSVSALSFFFITALTILLMKILQKLLAKKTYNEYLKN